MLQINKTEVSVCWYEICTTETIKRESVLVPTLNYYSLQTTKILVVKGIFPVIDFSLVIILIGYTLGNNAFGLYG